MYDPVFGGESGLGEVGVHKLDCVGDQLGRCFGVKKVETTVYFQGRSDIKTVASPVISIFSLGWFVVYNDTAYQQTHGSAGEVKVAV